MAMRGNDKALIVMIALLVCFNCCNTAKSKELNWVIRTQDKIKAVDNAYRDFQPIEANYAKRSCHRLSDPNTGDPNSFEGFIRIHRYITLEDPNLISDRNSNHFEVQCGIFDLWELTGRCLFLDYRKSDLSKNTPVILERYKSFIQANSNKNFEAIIAEGIESNINAIKTEYFLPAIVVLHKYIRFKTMRYIGYKFHSYYGHRKYQENAYAAMALWLKNNRPSFVWDQKFQIFRKKRNEIIIIDNEIIEPSYGFTLPEEVNILIAHSSGIDLEKIGYKEEFSFSKKAYDEYIKIIRKQK